ncbi:hypothetical protein L2E82_01511 [Cichorium intybus]|uniref:Uncharacterized protein n=1 Tax=Cichorium intybus TaxID=13427 RepID=A0ACB9GYT4_CICIN|nr:hypothetical protein L2E82_01511 [Cichorium intybus]
MREMMPMELNTGAISLLGRKVMQAVVANHSHVWPHLEAILSSPSSSGKNAKSMEWEARLREEAVEA